LKKILLGTLLLLTVIIFFSAILTGIGLFGVPKLAKINTNSNTLKQTVQISKKIAEEDYEFAISQLNQTREEVEKAKQEYEEMCSLTSNSSKSASDENYTKEFIWVKLGTYAKENNLEAKFEPIQMGAQANGNVCNINYTLLGNYIDIIDFIYEIEDDDDLNFIVENLEMIPSDDKVQATFTTKNILILK